MNDTTINEEKLTKLKRLAEKTEPLNKTLNKLETDMQFGDRSDLTALKLRITAEKLNKLTEKLTKIIKTL